MAGKREKNQGIIIVLLLLNCLVLALALKVAGSFFRCLYLCCG